MQQQLNKIDESSFLSARAPQARALGFLASGISLLVLFAFILAPTAYASQTNGTISSTYKYAWSDVGGYINFAPTHSIVSVTDTGLSGYVWSENDGWINLSPSQSGVTNNGNGILGGFAWDPLKGWVSFTGVTIDSSGKFHGRAVGANETISFDCASCDVRTDWRPVSTHIVTTKTSSTGSIALVTGTPGLANPLPGKQTLSAQLPNNTNSHSGGQTILSSSTSSTSKNSFVSPSHRTKTGIISSALTSSHFVAGSASTTANTVPAHNFLYIGVEILIILIIFFTARFLSV